MKRSSAKSDRDAAELTGALYGSVKVERPVDEPKRVAREYIRKKLVDGLQ